MAPHFIMLDIVTAVVDIWLSCAVAALTHWGQDQIDAISQTTFSNAF